MPKQFFISFWERSGSTFLVDLLNQHPEIYCREEILAGDEAAPVQRPPFSDEEAFKKINTIYSNTDKLCQGFKFKFPHQQLNFPKVAQHLYQTKAVIFLYRKNLVKLFISKRNQLALHKEFATSHTTKTNQEIRLSHKIRWDPSQDQFFHNYLNAALAYNLAVYKNAKRLSPSFYSMCYEDLVTHTESSLRLLFGFLGVAQPEKIQADSILTKVSSDTIEKNFENPDEFVRFVKKTQFKSCLVGEGEEIENWQTAYQIPSAKTWSALATFEEKVFSKSPEPPTRMKSMNVFEIEVAPDFDVDFYKSTYPETLNYYQPYCQQNGIEDKRRLFFHYVNHGAGGHYFKNLKAMIAAREVSGFALPDDFKPEIYRLLNTDISGFSDLEATRHFLDHGIREGRRYRLMPNEEGATAGSPLFINHDISLTGAPIFLHDLAWYLKSENIFRDPVIVDPYPSRLFSRYDLRRLYHFNKPDRLLELIETYRPPFIYSNSLNLLFLNLAKFRKYFSRTLFHFHESIENVDLNLLNQVRGDALFVVADRILDQFRKAGCTNVSIFPPFLTKDTQAQIMKNSQQSTYLRNTYRRVDQNRPVIGMVGSIAERKGFSLFYEAAKANPEAEFVWVGGEKDWKSKAYSIYKKSCEDLPNFFHVPFDQNPYKYFSVFDYFFLTSQNDPCPIVVLEALLLNKTVVVLKDNIFYDHGSQGLSNYLQIENQGKTDQEIINEVSKIFHQKPEASSQSSRYIEEQFSQPRLLVSEGAPEHYLILSYYLRADALAEIDYYVNLLNFFNLVQNQKWEIVISAQIPEGEDIDAEDIKERFAPLINLRQIFVQDSRGWDTLGLITGIDTVFNQKKINSETRVAYIHNKSNISWRDELFKILYSSAADIKSCDTLVSDRFYVDCPQDDLNREIFKRHPMFSAVVDEDFKYVQGTCFISRLEFLKPLFDHRNVVRENLTDLKKQDDYWLSVMKDDDVFERYYNFYKNNPHNSPMDIESQEIVKEGLVQNYSELLQKFGKKGIPDCQFEHALERYIGYLISHKKNVKTICDKS